MAQQSPNTGQQPVNFEAIQRFNIGSVLSRSIDTLKKSPVMFLCLAIMATMPAEILTYFSTRITVEDLQAIQSGNSAVAGAGLGAFSAIFVTFILGFIVQGGCAFSVFKILRKEPVDFNSSLKIVLSNLPALVVASLLITIGITIGTAFLIIPGVIIYCALAVAIPACVVEKLSALEALKRSAALTKGYRLRIFGIIFVTGLIVGVVSSILGTIFGSFGLVGYIILGAIVTVPQAFQYIVLATMYYDLRAIKDGVLVESMVNVFD